MLNSFIQTGLSLAKVAIKSKFKLEKTAVLPPNLAILGNGPSASLFIENQLKKELDKCQLVCRNCHSEIHYGV